MVEREPSDEQRQVLKAVNESRESELRHVHQELVDDSNTRFSDCPAYGDGYNQERRTVRKHLQELQSMGLADVDGRGKPWHLTTDGREKLVENE